MGKTEIHFPYDRVERNRRKYLWKRICCQKIRKGVLWTKNTTFADGWLNGCCTCCMYLPFGPVKSIWFLYKQLKWPDVVSFAQRTPFRIFWQQMRFHKYSPRKKTFEVARVDFLLLLFGHLNWVSRVPWSWTLCLWCCFQIIFYIELIIICLWKHPQATNLLQACVCEYGHLFYKYVSIGYVYVFKFRNAKSFLMTIVITSIFIKK